MAGGRPMYFARVYIYNRQFLSSGQEAQNMFIGQLMLKAGWYLDTTVELTARSRRWACSTVTATCASVTCRSRRRTPAAMRNPGISGRATPCWWMRDGSGRFENDLFQSEACPFGPILYLGGKAYKVALAPDCKSLRVEPWSETLAELALQPHGDQVKQRHTGLGGPEREVAAHPARCDRRQGHGAPRELPVIRVQPGGRQRLARPGNGLRHAAQPANTRERRRRPSEQTGLRWAAFRSRSRPPRRGPQRLGWSSRIPATQRPIRSPR